MIPFQSRYARLPEHAHVRQPPVPVAAPRWIAFNRPLAGTRVPDGATPVAMAYAGHQFGHFVPQLGDGRALLLGELQDREGRWFDVQLKGSGPTPFSRGGDGRAALGPVIREYLVSEAMHALGVPTTRALAAVTTGEQVQREQLLPGGVITRVARSHVRVGTSSTSPHAATSSPSARWSISRWRDWGSSPATTPRWRCWIMPSRPRLRWSRSGWAWASSTA